MNKQGKNGIEWCDYTWNPVTGCLHGCEYCYARKIANRFGGYSKELASEYQTPIQVYSDCGVIAALKYPLMKHTSNGEMQASYPFGFDPTFHRYRLSEPQQVKKSQRIFVVSMGDLFGEWIPDEWIQEVFKACEAAPWHKYLFLTKNPLRYGELNNGQGVPDKSNYWYGSTVTKERDPFACIKTPRLHRSHYFVSAEPLLQGVTNLGALAYVDWVIVGAETGNRKGKVIPEKVWIDDIATQCHEVGVPVFMKNSLKGLMGDDFIQEWPEGLRKIGI